MDLAEKIKNSVHYSTSESSLVSKISDVLSACECSKNLIIGIYLIEKCHFIYCNRKLIEILGDNNNRLLLDGWDYWYSMVDPQELASIKNKISNFFTPPYFEKLLTMRYHIRNIYGKNICIKHEILLHILERHSLAINYFFDVSEKERIEQFLKSNTGLNHTSPKKQILTISPREKQVLRLIADGHSSKEIADMLFISNHTAISHRKNLIEKFQVKNTAHLIKKASTLICL